MYISLWLFIATIYFSINLGFSISFYYFMLDKTSDIKKSFAVSFIMFLLGIPAWLYVRLFEN